MYTHQPLRPSPWMAWLPVPNSFQNDSSSGLPICAVMALSSTELLHEPRSCVFFVGVVRMVWQVTSCAASMRKRFAASFICALTFML